MATDLMQPGGGLTNSKLRLATATVTDVLSGKTFYSGDKELKTGTMNKATYHRKAVSFSAGSTNSGSKSYNVVTTFGIRSEVASGLSSDNFVGLATPITWPRNIAGASNIALNVGVGYNASTKTITVNWSSNYVETQFNIVSVIALWVD